MEGDTEEPVPDFQKVYIKEELCDESETVLPTVQDDLLARESGPQIYQELVSPSVNLAGNGMISNDVTVKEEILGQPSDDVWPWTASGCQAVDPLNGGCSQRVQYTPQQILKMQMAVTAQRLQKKRERERKRYESIKSDPELRKLQREKERQKYLRKKEKGLVKQAGDSSASRRTKKKYNGD